MSDGNIQAVTIRASRLMTIILLVLALSGIVGFIVGVLGRHSLRTWQAYLVNFLFWTGLSFGAVLFTAVLNVTGARWGRPLKRFSEGFGAFLPISFLLFWVLYFGRLELFPWTMHPTHERMAWLNIPFLFARDGFGLLLLTGISLALILFSVKGDRSFSIHQSIGSNRHRIDEAATEDKWTQSWRKQKIMSPILIITYAFVLTLIAFDLIMSLDPWWYSTLFGAYFLVGCFYTAIAAIYLLALTTQKTWMPEAYQGGRHFHDLGKLVLAFCLFTGYLFYAQFLTIWYGNLPDETRYVILRVKLTPWEPLAWLVLFMIFIVPFVVLLSREIKLRRLPMILLSVVVLTGMWLEKLILVAPSLWREKELPLGLTELIITAGFFGIFGLCFCWFMNRVPLKPISDPLFRELVEMNEKRLEP